jgi:hypothetical protein
MRVLHVLILVVHQGFTTPCLDLSNIGLDSGHAVFITILHVLLLIDMSNASVGRPWSILRPLIPGLHTFFSVVARLQVWKFIYSIAHHYCLTSLRDQIISSWNPHFRASPRVSKSLPTQELWQDGKKLISNNSQTHLSIFWNLEQTTPTLIKLRVRIVMPIRRWKDVGKKKNRTGFLMQMYTREIKYKGG